MLEKIEIVHLFNGDIETVYNERASKIPVALKSHDIDHTLTAAEISRIKKAIFENLWTWPDNKIMRSAIRAKSLDVIIHPDLALEILFPGANSIAYQSFNAIQVIYEIPISGAMNGMFYGVKGSGFNLPGKGNSNSITLYEFTQSDITKEVGDEMKSKRDKKLDKIQSVLNANKEYINSKQASFEALISEQVDIIYNASVAINERNKFL